MQKKKQSFQAIPNYSVSNPKNWNESKEVPAEQGSNDAGFAGFLIAGAVVTVNCRRVHRMGESGTNRAGSTPGARRMPMVRRNGAPFQTLPAAITAALFIECSSEI
jgi:hypothetical protein